LSKAAAGAVLVVVRIACSRQRRLVVADRVEVILLNQGKCRKRRGRRGASERVGFQRSTPNSLVAQLQYYNRSPKIILQLLLLLPSPTSPPASQHAPLSQLPKRPWALVSRQSVSPRYAYYSVVYQFTADPSTTPTGAHRGPFPLRSPLHRSQLTLLLSPYSSRRTDHQQVNSTLPLLPLLH
jgi:hypothetical protein